MLKDTIKKLRIEQGFSQDELAGRVHVVRQTVSKWERGTSVPDADSLVALACALGVSAAELLGESAPVERSPDELVLETGLLKERITQQDRSERIYRWAIALLIAVCSVVLVGACVYAATNEVGKFADGFEHGFQLQGSWSSGEGPVGAHSPTVSFGFVDDDGGVWRENLADGVEGADDWLKEWFTK